MSAIRAGFFLALWFFFNLLTVVGNRWLFQDYHFSYPLTLTAIHMMCCFVGAFFLLKVFNLQPFKEVSREQYMRRILPLAVLYCVNISFGNLSLNLIPVSLMQTVKSSVPAFNVIGQVLFLGRRFHTRLYLSILPVVLGVAVAAAASSQESDFSLLGVVAGIISSVFTAAQAIVSGLVLTGSDSLSSFNVMFYMAPPSLAMLAPFSLVFEVPMLKSWQPPSFGGAVLVLLISGIIAVLLNVATFLAIANTSSLSFNVAGNFKAVINIVVSVMIFGNNMNIWNVLGCAVTIVGVIWYNRESWKPMDAPETPPLPVYEPLPQSPDVLLAATHRHTIVTP
eukprot:TRINITY_DN7558_c0_g1_i4.p1 TRINITY_DN7558_c0_g1~~TRINITY_DN7558_c0_g1_i4.p1  ORF type:complete len:337 (+),score=48.75 TRINITY_DN7558_c0_g1_i4:56-1066(+)